MRKVVEEWLSVEFPKYDYIEGNASDLYWHTPASSDGDFVRIRRLGKDRAQITMKSTDMEDITNRVEVDVEIEDYHQGLTLCKGLFGEPIESVKKKYHVYLLENEDTTVSVYQVSKDKRVFIELEARGVSRVRKLTKSLMDFCEDDEFKWIKSSVYDMFVEKQEMKVREVDDFLNKSS